MSVVKFESQVENVMRLFIELREKSKYDDLSDIRKDNTEFFISAAAALVERIFGKSSRYGERFRGIQDNIIDHDGHKCLAIYGLLRALQFDLQNGYLDSFRSLIHGEVFSDFLEMAEHLHKEGYKDASAVIAGGVLEGHLKKLCIKYCIPTHQGSGCQQRPKKADALNSELCKASAYDVNDQKTITAWLGLRNDAAHGNYSSYTNDQVDLFLKGIRLFLSRVPA